MGVRSLPVPGPAEVPRQLGKGDRGRVDLDQQLPGRRLRARHLFDPEPLGATADVSAKRRHESRAAAHLELGHLTLPTTAGRGCDRGAGESREHRGRIAQGTDLCGAAGEVDVAGRDVGLRRRRGREWEDRRVVRAQRSNAAPRYRGRSR